MKKILLTVMGMLALSGHAQLTESFESPWTGSPAAPPGWTVVNENNTFITWQQSVAGAAEHPTVTGSHAAYLNRETVAITAPIPKNWLISPSFSVPENGLLTFYSRLTFQGDQGGIYKVLISSDADAANLLAYTELYSASELMLNPIQLQYTQKAIVLPPSTGPVHIAFVMIGNNADRWLIDDVSVTSACPAPANVTITNLLLTQATINWEETGSASQWEVEVVPAGSTPTETGIVTSAMPFVVTGLAPGDFKVYVRSICGNASKSQWSTPVYLETPTNVVRGVVKYNSDGNGGCDATDPAFTNTEVKVSINGVYSYSEYTNSSGQYNIYGLPDGATTLSLQVVAPAGFEAIDPLEQVVTFGNGVLEQIVNHCITQENAVNDISVTVTPTGVARPGFAAGYKLTVKNAGTSVIGNTAVSLTYNAARLTFITTDNPSTTHILGTIVVNFANLAPLTSYDTYVSFTVQAPPVNIGSEMLHFVAEVSEIEDDATPYNNSANLYQNTVNSFDPNDITLHELSERYLEEAEDYLTYTIRFQNTGTAEAIDIKLENTLDALLDWSTFEPITSSHGYSVKRVEDQLTFEYKNINLPDSTANEPGSHGFVTYKVKPKAGIEIGDVVSNTAEIYFDFNEAIVTNTATMRVVAVLGREENTISPATLYPNPVKDQLTVAVNQGELRLVTIHDINGRLCLSANANAIDTSALNSGVYFVKVTTDAGSANYKIIKY